MEEKTKKNCTHSKEFLTKQNKRLKERVQFLENKIRTLKHLLKVKIGD